MTSEETDDQKRIDRAFARLEMADWVSNLARWDTYGTMTFAFEIGMESARKCFERFVAREQPGVPVFYALERNPSRDGYHVHCLLATTRGCYRRFFWERWYHRYGRARIVPVTAVGGVAGYCAKYVTKETAWWNALNCQQGAL